MGRRWLEHLELVYMSGSVGMMSLFPPEKVH